MNRVLVTGASGFIGPSLCRRLQAQGKQVIAVMRRPAAGPWDQAYALTLGRDKVPDELLEGVDSVFHLAGKAHALADGPQAEEEYRLSNLQSTLDLLTAARGHPVRAFVYISSVKAMGEGGEEIEDETTEPNPRTPYGLTKLAAERQLLEGGAIPHPVVLRPSLVYGPDPKGYLALLIGAVRGGWFPPLPDVGNGRSMIHRDDLVEAMLLAAADPRAAGRTYLVADAEPYSTRQIYAAICNALGRTVPGWHLPLGLLRLAAGAGDAIGGLRGRRFFFDSDVLAKFIGSARYDGGLIRRELGFEPTRTLPGSMKEIVSSLP